jgi:hypothetical protein
MLVMAAVSAQPLPLIQAGASAVLVVVLQHPKTGGERILNALIGGGVALIISQILFPPSPVSLLRDAGREALSSIAEGLRASVRVLRWPRCGYRNRFGIPAREETGSTADLGTARETSG